jgi:hypothetical protein
VLAHLIRHPADPWLLGYAGVAGSILQLFSVVLKYAHYRPNEDHSRNAWLIGGLALPGVVFPHIAVVPVLMILFYYRKSRRNVAQYLL